MEKENSNKNWRKFAIILAMIFIPIVLAVAIYFTPEMKINVVNAFLAGFFVSSIFLFIYIFTGPIKHENDMVWMFRYSYMYIPVSMLVVTAVPFAIAEQTEFIKKIMHHNTVGILQGCREKITSDEDIPHEIRCSSENIIGNERPYQWVTNIGGYIKNANSSRSEPSSNFQEASLNLTRENSSRSEPSSSFQKTSLNLTRENSSEDMPTIDLKNIVGGFVFPLYIAIITIIGGAVSMTRRVPDIQRQVWPCFDKNGNEKPDNDIEKIRKDANGDIMLPGAARQHLIFQMVQVFTAPFIAMMTYYIVSPDSLAISVALAFISGYASEIILALLMSSIDYLKISLNEKLTPNGK